MTGRKTIERKSTVILLAFPPLQCQTQHNKLISCSSLCVVAHITRLVTKLVFGEDKPPPVGRIVATVVLLRTPPLPPRMLSTKQLKNNSAA